MTNSDPQNPFQYQTPDGIEAHEALSLFVDVFKDFYHLINVGNTFIHGPRGSGKSMMFRIMKPDCQKLRLEKDLLNLPFYGVHVPVKDTSLRISDIDKLEKNYGANYLNEHFMVLYFSICLFDALCKEDFSKATQATNEAINFYNNVYSKRMRATGWEEVVNERNDFKSANEVFSSIRDICGEMQSAFTRNYVTKLSLSPDMITYSGALCLYSDFFFPLVKEIRKLSFMPKSPIYLMVDDADELNLTQTQILNSWVSFRSTNELCFKISTQLMYKTHITSTGSKVDSPHDYYEIDLTEAYTSDRKEKYKRNVKDIIEKRLIVMGGLNTSAEKYFPVDEDQVKQIEEVKKRLIEVQKKNGKEDRQANDYAYRYATSEYIKQLMQTGEGHGHNYSYAGFNSLVHLSSNIIRNFLDLASKMYVATYNSNSGLVSLIPVKIQDSEIDEYSNWYLNSNFESLRGDQSFDEVMLDKHKKLYNLIDSLGQTFSRFFKSDLAERRMFSFYFEDEPSKDLDSILRMGVSYGYFHRSSKGNKRGTGRARLYVLNRMLAPIYRLDPLSFSGYLFLTIDKMELATLKPKEFLKYIDGRIKNGNREQEEAQLPFEFE
jgi:hypothetical protein